MALDNMNQRKTVMNTTTNSGSHEKRRISGADDDLWSTKLGR